MPEPAPHPGEILREKFMEPLGISSKQLADRLGVARSTTGKILNGRAGITAEMAMRLSRVFSVPVEYWLALQAQYEFTHVSETDVNLEAITPFETGAISKTIDQVNECLQPARSSLRMWPLMLISPILGPASAMVGSAIEKINLQQVFGTTKRLYAQQIAEEASQAALQELQTCKEGLQALQEENGRLKRELALKNLQQEVLGTRKAGSQSCASSLSGTGSPVNLDEGLTSGSTPVASAPERIRKSQETVLKKWKVAFLTMIRVVLAFERQGLKQQTTSDIDRLCKQLCGKKYPHLTDAQKRYLRECLIETMGKSCVRTAPGAPATSSGKTQREL